MSNIPIGKVYGDLTVIRRGPDLMRYRSSRNQWFGDERWIVECACGVITTKLKTNVTAGRTTSCGGHGRANKRRPASNDTGNRSCSVGGCNRPHRGLGFCELHRDRFKRGIPLDAPIRGIFGPRQPDCSVDGCTRESQVKEMCRAHYQNAYKGYKTCRPLGPIALCSVDKCLRDSFCRGLCPAHHQVEARKRRRNVRLAQMAQQEFGASEVPAEPNKNLGDEQ